MLTIIETRNSTYEVLTSDAAPGVVSIRRTAGIDDTVLDKPDGEWLTFSGTARITAGKELHVHGVGFRGLETTRVKRVYDRRPNGQRALSHLPGALDLIAPAVKDLPGFHLVAG